MNKKVLRIISIFMFIGFIVFFIFAINNPQLSFPWSNTVSYTIYGVYLLTALILFIFSYMKK